MALAYGYQLYLQTPVTKPEVYVNGLPLSSIAKYGWGSLHTKTFTKGDDEATWSIITLPGTVLQRHPSLVYGAPIDIKLGPTPIWCGALTEPDWDSASFAAIGAPHEAEAAICFNGSGQTTTKPNTAVDQAISRGAVGWSRRDNFGTTAVGNADDATDGLTYLDQLLDAWADEQESGWAINARRELLITGAPTAGDPRWFITPGSGTMGAADDSRIDRVFVRYVSTAAGNPLATTSWPAATPQGGREAGVNITSRGAISATRAQNIAKGIWGKLAGHSGWTNGFTLTRGQVSTPGGLAAELGFIRALDTARALNTPDPRNLDHHIDFVIGDTDLDWDAESIQINPMGLATLDEVIGRDYPNSGFVAL